MTTTPRLARDLRPGDTVGPVRVEKTEPFMGRPAHGNVPVPCVMITWSNGTRYSLGANTKVAR